MPFLRKIKKIVPIIIGVALVAGLFVNLQNNEAEGSWNQFKNVMGSLFSTEDKGMSFTQFEGELGVLNPEGYADALVRSTDLRDFIMTIVNFALGFLGLFAVLIVIYGGVLYVGSGGEEEKTKTGKNAIKYAAIGLLIVLGSFAFVNTILRGVGGELEGERRFIAGSAVGSGFNAMSSEIESMARNVFEEFALLMEAREEMQNITADAGKASLNYGGDSILVQRADVLGFMHSMKDKLTRIRARFITFSPPYQKINEILREIDKDIDEIRSFPERQARLKADRTGFDTTGGRIRVCTDEWVVGWAERLAYDCVRYPVALYPKWNAMRSAIIGEVDVSGRDERDYRHYNLIRESEDSVLGVLRAEYKNTVDENVKELERIYQSVSHISAAQSGEIKTFYDDTMERFRQVAAGLGRGDDIEGQDFIQNLYQAIEGQLNFIQNLYQAIEGQLKLAEAMGKLQTVEARLRANVIRGKAPLTVLFDVNETIDPAGGSLRTGNIIWYLEGNVIFDERFGVRVFDKDSGSGLAYIGGEQRTVSGVDCTHKLIVREQNVDMETFGQTFSQCTYSNPGTYLAKVIILSNDPMKYVPGTSYIRIVVEPPTTFIDLKMKAGEKEITIMKYTEGGILVINKNNVPVTLDEARSGITFDASKTKASSYNWNFDNGTVIIEDTSGIQEEIKYPNKGQYRVELTTVNNVGEIDKKIFTLDVRDIAARIGIAPRENIFMGDSVRFDASNSSGEGIRTYEWEITNKTTGEKEDIGRNKNELAFNHRFTELGEYKVELTVSSPVGKDTTDEVIVVASRPPVAVFEYSTPRSTQPGTVHFDAMGSFDPDGDKENLIYEWSINPDSENKKNWEWADDSGPADINPVVQFNEKGNYDVKLKVTDSRTIGQTAIREESGTITKKITIDDILGIAWGENNNVDNVAQLDEQSEARITFSIVSPNASEYEIDFGDGEKASGRMGEDIVHTYKKAGTFEVIATVYDKDDNKNSIKKRVYIGGGDSPLAKINVEVNNARIYDRLASEGPLTISKVDTLRFDASESINTDGTGRNLIYSWDFGDMGRSSSRIATHSYKDFTPKEMGHYTVRLRVTDQNDPSKFNEDLYHINVVPVPPKFSNVQGIPEFRVIGALRTPINVNVRAFNAEDPDGEITQYRWWYFDEKEPDVPLGIQITTQPTARLIIGTKGLEGQEMTYGFGLEIKDNDNLTYSNKEDIMLGNYSTLTVVNGPNKPPTASFTVDSTTVFAGDPVNFTSTSTDPDGEIIRYYWDFDGDGFYNVEGTAQSNISHVYTKRNMEGYNVRLKVVDDKGAEAVSPPIKVYVDSHAEPPRASFLVEPADISLEKGEFTVQFKNTSKPDEEAGAEIISYQWDFNTTYDSTGDGVPDNDIDSTEQNPVRSFPGQGNYIVKLTVMDNQGNVSETTQTIRVPLAEPPKAAFIYEVKDGKVHFRNRSTSDLQSGAAIVRYIWDFDSNVDTSGDGTPDNDEDSTIENPIHSYSRTGRYNVKLTVRDSHGGTDSITREVNFVAAQQETPTPSPDVPSTGIRAFFTTTPASAADGVIYLSGNSGTVTFDFTKSAGPISRYIFDKNIYFDTSGDGVPDNDVDFQTILPGRWTTNFERAWGRIGVKLTVEDMYGNKHSTTKEIKFK
jgi:PKD repeat protein